MKYSILALIILFYPLQAELTVAKIDEMVKQIQGKRQSKVKVDFEKVASPFATVVQEDVNSTPVLQEARQQMNFQLNAIINNRAQINKKWVTVGDMLQGYRVESIAADRVVLKKADHSVEIFLPKPKKLLQFQIK